MGSPVRIANYAPAGVAQLISMYSKARGALASLLPVILGVTPNAGPAAGGTLIRITGYNFENASVTIGGVPVTNPIVGGGIITCYSPPGAGPQPVVVRGPGGARTLVAGFTYPGTAPGTLTGQLGTARSFPGNIELGVA